MQRLFTRGRPAALAHTLHGRPLLGYLFAVAMFGLALFLRLELIQVLPPGLPFITFLPAILLVAFLAGRGPAIFSALLSGICAWYLFVAPTHSFELTPQIALALLFFWGVVGIGVSIIDHLRKVALSLEEERQRSADLAEQRAYLFKELQHRVANNMSFLVAILSMQKSAMRTRPMAATDILDDAIRRIRLFSNIHRRLHDPASATASLENHFQGLFKDLMEATDAKHIQCVLDVEQVQLQAETVMTLSLIAAELMTNAIKHAFAGREAGTITVTLKRATEGFLFVIADDGVGKPADCDGAKGLGCLIVDALSDQIQATRDISTVGGTRVALTFSEPD
ncbi:MAG: sensor histidine kinase [Chakrabartia godavariana]